MVLFYISEDKISLNIEHIQRGKQWNYRDENHSTFRVSTRRSSKHGSEIVKPVVSTAWFSQEEFRRHRYAASNAGKKIEDNIAGMIFFENKKCL